jgi:hypothetical protein
LVRTSTVVTLDRLDKALTFETTESFIERSRSNTDPGKALDVLGQRISVLRPFGKAGKDKCRWSGIAPEPRETGSVVGGLLCAP